ncbi:MAG: hypothetical protein ACR2NR_22725 [Solirubrobacteraceae bacterium]
MTASGYTKLLRSRGVPRMVVAVLTVGIASTMTPVAFVLFARAATDSFATASLVLAASTVGGLLVSPLRGRLIDRRGAREAVPLLAIPDIVTDIAFIARRTWSRRRDHPDRARLCCWRRDRSRHCRLAQRLVADP